MIGFGCVTADDDEFQARAGRAIGEVGEPDSLLLRRHDPGAVGGPCNEMLDRAAERRDLEAFVLVAEDVSFAAGGFTAQVRRLLATYPDAALMVGADRLDELGSLGGGLLVLSPAAVRELRFDESLVLPFACAVADVCHEARSRGQRVVASDFRVLRPVQCKRLGDRGRLVRGAAAVRRKWGGGLAPGVV